MRSLFYSSFLVLKNKHLFSTGHKNKFPFFLIQKVSKMYSLCLVEHFAPGPCPCSFFWSGRLFGTVWLLHNILPDFTEKASFIHETCDFFRKSPCIHEIIDYSQRFIYNLIFTHILIFYRVLDPDIKSSHRDRSLEKTLP